MDTYPARPDGLQFLTRADLLADRRTDAEIRVSIHHGDLVRIGRGAYQEPVPAAWPIDRYRLRVQARALGSPHAVLSHVSAAALHHLPIDGANLSAVHLTRVGPSGSRRTPGFVMHAARLEATEFVTVDGLPTTSVARTLVDLGRSDTFETTVVAADAALHRDLVSADELAVALVRGRRRPGVGNARRALAFADGRSESVGESRMRVAIHAAGLPAPQLQVTVSSRDGRFLGRCDAGYAELAVLIEFDGMSKYLRSQRPGEDPATVVVREKLREDLLRAAGYIVVRVTWGELACPRALARRIREAMDIGRIVVASGVVTGSCRPGTPLRVSA